MPMLVGGASAGRTLLAECPDALLTYFTTPEACALRLVCRELQAAVAAHAWEDMQTVIQGSIARWRACFPGARCANVRRWALAGRVVRRAPVVDADFAHLAGLRELNMSGCTAVTDAAFARLRGIRVLDMSSCPQPALTPAAFAHLGGIQKLSIWNCLQATDAALAPLRGIRVLNMTNCRRLTDAALAHLRGIHTLFMWGCRQPAITDAGLAHLAGIHSLCMEGCAQASITAAGLAPLAGITNLCMAECDEEVMEAAGAAGLPVVRQHYAGYGAFDCTFAVPVQAQAQAE
jgi:hypothetical protein